MQIERWLFIDTSALVKHYHEERGSGVINQLWDDSDNRLFISRLAVLEMISALAAKYRAHQITLDEFNSFRHRLYADIGEGRPQAIPLTNAHCELALMLLVS
jgi:uncharacterized protein with PIN domain